MVPAFGRLEPIPSIGRRSRTDLQAGGSGAKASAPRIPASQALRWFPGGIPPDRW